MTGPSELRKTSDGLRIGRAYDDEQRSRGVHLAYRIAEPVPHCWMCPARSSRRTDEHVFPQWLLQRLDLRHVGYGSAHYSPYGQKLSERAEVPFAALVNGQICEDCNTGWMSHLEDSFSRLFPSRDAAGPLSQADRLTMARWFAKTAIVINTCLNWRLLFSAGVRHTARTRVPRHTSIFLGWSAETDDPVPLQQMQTNPMLLNVPAGGETRAYRDCERTLVSAMRVGPLTATAVHSPAGTRYEPSGMAELWPPNQPVRWEDLPLVKFVDAGIVGSPELARTRLR